MIYDFKGVSLPDFDYSKHGLDHLAQEADTAAAQLSITLSNIGNLLAKAILTDAPRLLAIREILKESRCWTEWLKTKYPKNHQTAYNLIEISNTLEKLRNDYPERFSEIEKNLLHCSGRALRALSSTGTNIESVLELFSSDLPTEKQVREFTPANQREIDKIFQQVDQYAKANELDKFEIRSETEDLAKDIAERRGRITPSAIDYQDAGSQITGTEVRLPKKAKSTPSISLKDFQELQKLSRIQHARIQELQQQLDEKEALIKQLLDALAAGGVEVSAA